MIILPYAQRLFPCGRAFSLAKYIQDKPNLLIAIDVNCWIVLYNHTKLMDIHQERTKGERLCQLQA